LKEETTNTMESGWIERGWGCIINREWNSSIRMEAAGGRDLVVRTVVENGLEDKGDGKENR
jgi:hypothetical protein